MASNFQKIKNKEEWQVFLNGVLFKTFFHSLEWEEFLERKFKWLKFERYNWQNRALLSLANIGGKKLVSHPFCEYGGPLPLVEKIDGASFIEDLLSEFHSSPRINFHPHLFNYFNGLGPRYLGTWRKTYFLERSPLSSLRYDVRHAIKRAENQDFRLEECRSEKDLKDFYRLYLKTIRRHKNLPLPFSFFQFFSENAKIILLKLDKRIATGSAFLFNKPFIHYFITAADWEFRREGVNHLLLWRVIEEYLGQDYRMMDLGATRMGSDLEIFKRGWRGRELPIWELGSRSSRRTSRLRNVLGVLPVALLERLSPHLLRYKLS